MSRSLTDEIRTVLTRRRFVLSAAASVGLAGVGGASLIRSLAPRKSAADIRFLIPRKPAPDVFEEVTPDDGIDTGVTFGDAIPRLIAAGALVPDKLRALGGGLPRWVGRVLDGRLLEPIIFSRDRAPYLVNLLWPIGLSNRVVFNRRSPINTDHLAGFASTGGWTLGRAPDGSAYFDAIDAVPLTDRQAFLALAIATNTFRPCCDNSTFFQDSNHGSALLGLIELAVAQGATADAIYRMALTANSYWFPEKYARTAQLLFAFREPFVEEGAGAAGPGHRLFHSQQLAAKRRCPPAAGTGRFARRPSGSASGVRHMNTGIDEAGVPRIARRVAPRPFLSRRGSERSRPCAPNRGENHG